MNKRRLMITLITALLICSMLCGCANNSASGKDSVSIWYLAGDSLVPSLEGLVDSYNKSREGDALPVSLRAFGSEEELAAAFAAVPPDLLLCSHAKAIDLYERGALRDLSSLLGSELPAYSQELLTRFDGVSKSFFPLGSAVQLLYIKQGGHEGAFKDFESLFTYAAKYGAENNAPFLTADSFSSIVYENMLSLNVEFRAAEQFDLSKSAYVDTYNTIAEAAYSGGLVSLEYSGKDLVQSGYLPAAIVSSVDLARTDLAGCELQPLPHAGSGKACLAVNIGLAATVREGRSAGSTAAFLRWLFAEERIYALALDSGLVPSVSGALAKTDALSACLLDISESYSLHLPDNSSDFIQNSSEFETDFRRAINLLN